jgi:4a-hydroxytetrahydrobiopterin dehydratase
MWFNKKDSKLNNIFEFNNFKEALVFINKVWEISEKINHHPDIKIFNYKFVEIEICTHSENKITNKDYELAELINKI